MQEAFISLKALINVPCLRFIICQMQFLLTEQFNCHMLILHDEPTSYAGHLHLGQLAKAECAIKKILL